MSKKNDNFFKEKKDWSKTKDAILGKYLVPYFAKLIALGKPICYVDCFAGKGKFDDGNNGSPLIALDCMNKTTETSNYGTQIYPYFIELNHYNDLQKNVSTFCDNVKNDRIRWKVISGKFEDNIDYIIKQHLQNTVFLYVDPYGIKAIDIEKFNSFKSSHGKSVEMLINFNTWGFFREACRVLGADFKLDASISKYLVEYDPNNNLQRDELCKIAGGDYWINIVLKYKNNEIKASQAELELSKGIADAFSKKYRFVLNVPIKSSDDNRVPKYRLFHLTNHTDGCLLMAQNMYDCINDATINQRNGQESLFPLDVEGCIYSDDETEKILSRSLPEEETRISEFLCFFYTKYGLIRSPKDLRKILKQLEEKKLVDIRREPSITKKGKKSSFMEDKGSKQCVYIRRMQK